MDWQTLLAIAIVVSAGGYVFRQAARFVRGDNPSGGCNGCPSKHAAGSIKNLPLIQLELPERPSNLHRSEPPDARNLR